MRLAIHINFSECMRSADVKDDDLLKIGELYNFRSIRRHKLARAAGRFTTGVRFEFVVAPIVVNGLRPWLVRSLGIGEAPAACSPDPFILGRGSQARMTIRPAWSRFRRNFRLITTATSAATALSEAALPLLTLTLTL